MYFVLVKEIETGKIVNKAELDANQNINGELANLAFLVKRQFQNRYPSTQFDVIISEAENYNELLNTINNQKVQLAFKSGDSTSFDSFSMFGSLSYLLITNIAAMVGGTIILFILLAMRLIYNPFIFILGVFILFIYLVIDYKIWTRKGIHIVAIDKNGLTLFIGDELKLFRIKREEISDVIIKKSFKRIIVTILLGGSTLNVFSGINLLPGNKIKLTDDAFRGVDFKIFIKKINELWPNLRI